MRWPGASATGIAPVLPRSFRPSRLLGLLVAALIALPAAAGTAAPFLWQLRLADDPRAAVHTIVGSIHLLPSSAHPLPAAYDRAYSVSARIVFETDPAAIDSAQLQQQLLDAARDAPRGLRAEIGAPLYARLATQLPRMQLPVQLCDAVRAWFCALTLELAAFQRAGFLPALGVDRHFFERAQVDGKSIAWLEAPEQQLALFADMPDALGAAFLASALDGVDDPEFSPERLLRAWREHDTGYLQSQVTEMRRDYPQAYARLLADRNAAWLEPLDALLRERTPTLVVVGAAHLVGADSVLDGLRARGYAVTESSR